MTILEKIKQNRNLDFYPLLQFKILNACLGFYFLFHSWGMYRENIFTPIMSKPQVLLVTMIGALFLIVGIQRRVAAILVWLSFYYFLKGNMHLYGINHDYTGWLLLMVCLVPDQHEEKTFMPEILYEGGWLILGLGYLASGINKMSLTPYWMSGEVLNMVYHKDWFALKFFTWGALMAEIFFFPMIFFKRSRPLAYVLMTLMHITLALTTNLTEISLGALLFHLFLFDCRWLQKSFWREYV